MDTEIKKGSTMKKIELTDAEHVIEMIDWSINEIWHNAFESQRIDALLDLRKQVKTWIKQEKRAA